MSPWPWASRARPSLQPRAVADLLRSLTLIVEPDTLRASIAARIRELTGCDEVLVCMVRSQDGAYVASVPTPDETPREVVIPDNSRLARWLKTNQVPFAIPHPHGAFEYLEPAERDVLNAHRVRVCVPVFSGALLLAILLICTEQPTWRVEQTDLDLLVRLGRQVGLALENAGLHQLERERIKNLYRAEQLAVAGQLAATVAHEIRNPLTAIRSTIQYVVQSSTPLEAKLELLEQTLAEVDRIERTIGGVLALSRRHELEFSDINLVAGVEHSLLVIQAYAQSQGIAIERQFEAETLLVHGDERGLQQVCINLFLNACQAMPHGGRLTLRCSVWQPSADAKALAVLQVRDTGTGISHSDLAKVFDPFFTTKRTGTGLGLPISLDVVTRHGGNLRVESQPGQGTVATVLLPLRSA